LDGRAGYHAWVGNFLCVQPGTGIERIMITRTALLYLSKRHNLKDYFSRFDAFKRITGRFIAGEDINEAIFAIRGLNGLGIAASFDHHGRFDQDLRDAARLSQFARAV
jgi:hypothetical protein